MIPLRDENPARTTPYIVYILIAANVLIYLYNGSLGPHTHNPLAGFELVPAKLFGGRDLGAPGPVAPWMTIFTSMFMHANLFHVGGNMLYLWIFGNNIEDVLGHFNSHSSTLLRAWRPRLHKWLRALCRMCRWWGRAGQLRAYWGRISCYSPGRGSSAW